MKKFLACCFIFPLLTVCGFSAPILTENFNYANGSLITNSSFVWSAHSGTTGQTQVISGKAQLSQNQTEDVHANLPGGPYSIGNLYASFTVNFSSLPSGSGNYFLHFHVSSSTFRGKVFATTSGATSGKFLLGVENNGTPIVTIPFDLSLNTDYTFVLRYSNATPATTLWLNPSAESDTSNRADATDSTTAQSISAISLRQSNSGGGMGILTFDNLLVGTNFADVVPPGTEPSITAQPQSQAVSAGANVTFTVSASGSQPLSYQWNFNGGPINGATASSLVLNGVTAGDAGSYDVVITNLFGQTNSDVATLDVSVPDILFSLLQYNVKGNGATNWNTNSPQVQAIGRVVQYLNPDIITFNEIPNDQYQYMTNFVKTYLTGYYLGTNSGTDGFIRSVIASRYPIVRTNKWLDGADLDPFGYTNANFTRDLFEAQISVPGLSKPLHVFTTHLKSSSGGYTDAANKRAAEAAAITNFFATNFFTYYSNDLYTLSGDMNEDNTNTLAIQRLVSAPMGLQMINPVNASTGSSDTYTSTNPSSRLDYIFPCTVLSTNINSKQVFRADKIGVPPAPLTTNDTRIASDHLPVLMVFNNPYATSQPYTNPVYKILSFSVNNQSGTFKWESLATRSYTIERSTDFTNWSIFRSNLVASSTNFTFTTNVPFGSNFFRIYRQP